MANAGRVCCEWTNLVTGTALEVETILSVVTPVPEEVGDASLPVVPPLVGKAVLPVPVVPVV